MSPYHIDESSGSDATGNGAAETPYATIAFALFTHGQDSKVLVRKDPNTPYDDPTQSALKKAKKGADGLEKKKKKAEELAEKEAAAQGAEREKRDKLLEESKKIQLVEDTKLPKSTKVSIRRPNLPDIAHTTSYHSYASIWILSYSRTIAVLRGFVHTEVD